MPILSRRTLMASGLASAGISLAQASPPGPAAPAPYGATPSPRQLAWHRREQYAFVHFSINT